MSDQVTPASAVLFARAVLVRRLADRHGLSREDALAAVLLAEQHLDGPHAAMASAAIEDALAPVRRSITEMVDVLLPAIRALGKAAHAAMASRPGDWVLSSPPLEDDAAHPPAHRPRDRPAWQSPYGPPTRHR